MSVPNLFQRKYLTRWLYVFGAVLLLAAAGVWWTGRAYNPETVFNDMLAGSLRTRGVTMSSTQNEPGRSIAQTIQYSLGVDNKARAFTVATQGAVEVKTEIVGNSAVDYTRYVSVKSPQKDESGKPLDFSKIEDVWAKSSAAPGGSRLVGQALLGLSLPLGAVPVPIGNLTPKAQTDLLDQMRTSNVYETDFKKAKKEKSGGRTYFVYDVQMQVIAYANLMKNFGKAAGLHELDDLDPNNYQGAAPLKLRFKVDAYSRQLVEVKLPDADFTQNFGSYDIAVAAALPEKSISESELQKRLGELQ